MESNCQKSWNNGQGEDEALDRALDAALAKYSAVEPRTGLEQRILASLRSERDRVPVSSRWQWSAVGVLALVVIIAALAWKSNRPTKSVAQQHAPAPIERVASTSADSSRSAGLLPTRRAVQTNAQREHSALMASKGPKLTQFPSPEPLTQEELALVRYAKQFPEDAVVIASAQEEFEKEIQQEAAASGQSTSNSIEEER
jgi:hypothetical protein